MTDRDPLERLIGIVGMRTFASQLAGVGEDCRAVALKVLAVLDPGQCTCEELFEPCLALLERPGPPVLAVELQQVEGIEEHLAVMRPAVQLLEHRQASSQQTASPSIVTELGRSAATALRMSGYRSVQSKPLRVISRTRSSRLRAIRR